MRHRTSIFAAAVMAATLCACAQEPHPIRILAVPADLRDLGLTKADMPLTLTYPGKIAVGEQVFVRVFRGSPADLKGKYAQALRVGKCVLFTSSARYEVNPDGDGVLRIYDVVDYFRNNTGQETQVLTLVFEVGGEDAPSAPLKLSLNGLNTYFDNAMTTTMTAPGQMKDYWKSLIAEQKQAQQRAQSTQTAHNSGGLFSWFGLKTVEAKEQAPAPVPEQAQVTVSQSPGFVDGQVVKGPCQKVTPISLAPGKKGPSDAAETDSTPLRAFAELTPAACGL